MAELGHPRGWVLASLVVAWGCGGGQRRPIREPPAELVGAWYVVVAGDSVSKIARAQAVASEDIIELNGLEDPDSLAVGQALFLYGVEEILRRHASASPAPPPRARPSGPSFHWPIDGGRLSSGYGPRGARMHKGVDIAVRPGTPVLAAAAGVVVYSDNKQRGYGNLVILRHPGGWASVYAHNRRNLVDEGERVRQGARIAEVGSTGHSTGPHLHFEVRRRGEAVDPLIHLPAR